MRGDCVSRCDRWDSGCVIDETQWNDKNRRRTAGRGRGTVAVFERVEGKKKMRILTVLGIVAVWIIIAAFIGLIMYVGISLVEAVSDYKEENRRK